MLRNTTGSNWIVQKLIERDHINHHYRRLDGARSQLQLKGYTSHGSANFKGRLSKSSQDLSRSVGFENRLRNLERQMTSQFSLDVVIVDEKKKKDLFDEKQDVINRHSKYFTQPKQNFTPRLVRKVVRPVTAGKLSTTRSATPATQRPTTATLGSSSSGSSCLQQRRPLKAVYFPVNNHQHRNVSDDSAFDDGHYSSNDSVESSGSSEDLSAFNFQKWLKKQEEESCYMQLMCDITADLLQRHLCTYGNMKDIISIYIRKSRRKFSIGANVLMRRLCDDLQIPMDSTYDDRYYGSRIPRSSQPGDCYHSSLREIEPPACPVLSEYCSGRSQMPELSKTKSRSSTSSPKSPIQLEPERFQEPPDSDDEKDRRVSGQMDKPQQGTSSVKVEINIGKVPAEMDGYYSDFTNDTDNDIEEEFDFD